MPETVLHIATATGLSTGRVSDLATLISDVTGSGIDRAPILAPVLLFSDPEVQTLLSIPLTQNDTVLVQEAQGIVYLDSFPLDTELATTVRSSCRGNVIDLISEFSSAQQPVATLSTTLRLIAAQDLQALKPAAFRPGSMSENVTWSGPMTISQDQTDRYLVLSGDQNPVHHDPGIVAGLGLSAPIVPGLLLVSMIQPGCEALLPGALPTRLNCRFMAPLAMGASFRIGIQPRGPLTGGVQKMRAYMIDNDDRALCVADLQFRVTPD